jgi:hypothetical protein
VNIAIEGSARLSLVVLVAANAVVLWGVIAHQWDVFPILLLFWLENVIVGVLFVARLLAARAGDAATWVMKLFLVPFFCVHYGMFTLVHGIFVVALFGGAEHGHLADGVDFAGMPGMALQLMTSLGLWIPVIALAASHAFSFVWNFIVQGEYREAQPKALMTRPYGRVIALHVTIIAGGGLAMVLGSPLWALLLLLGIKTAMDARAHVREHGGSESDVAVREPGVA